VEKGFQILSVQKKRLKYSIGSPQPHHDLDDHPVTSQVQPQPVLPHPGPSTPTHAAPLSSSADPSTFTTINGPPPRHKNLNNTQTLQHTSPQPQLASPPITTSPTTTSCFNHTEPTISVDIPLSSISRILESQRNSLIDQLRAQNATLIEKCEKQRAEIATIQSKYNSLEKKMNQFQEILEGKKLGEEEGNAE